MVVHNKMVLEREAVDEEAEELLTKLELFFQLIDGIFRDNYFIKIASNFSHESVQKRC